MDVKQGEHTAILKLIRLFFYAFLVLFFIFSLQTLSESFGIHAFRENAFVENVQIFLLFLACLSFGLQAKAHNELRSSLLLLVSGCLLAICRELDDVFAGVFPLVHWKFGFVFSMVAILYVYIHRKAMLYAVFSFSRCSIFFMVFAVFVLLPLAELIEDGYFHHFQKGNSDIKMMYEEIVEAFSYLLIFLSSLEMHFSYQEVLSKFYDRYGKNAELTLLSKTADKTVYNVKTSKGEYILMIVFDVSSVRFFKYVSSQAVQQCLYEDKMDVAKIEDSYLDKGNLIYVQQKIEGTNSFPRTEENMYKIGELLGKLHQISSSSKYEHPFMFVKHPNVFFRVELWLRDVWLKKISFYVRYFKIRNFPKGICHRDINNRNIIMKPDGSLALIDFDMHRYQPFVEGIVRFYQKRLSDKKMFYPFMKGYNAARPLTEQEKEYLEKKLAIKLVL